MLLELRELRKAYRKRGHVIVNAVDGVSFQVDGGQILGFLGPNGAGKSTTIKMIAGLITPDEGDVLVAGESVSRHRQRALRHIGAVLEGSRNLYWRLSPMGNLQYWAGLRGVGRREAARRARDLLDLFELTHKTNSTVQQLSRGMQQKVAICAALIHRPALLLLDEPTLGLDLESSDKIQQLVLELAREQRIGVVLTTHQMEVAQALSNQIAIIQSGQIVLEGKKEDVLQQFGGNAYIIETVDDIRKELRLELEENGALFDSNNCFRIAFSNPQMLYHLLEKLHPTPIVRVERDTADLATVFRHYTQAQSDSKQDQRATPQAQSDAAVLTAVPDEGE